MKTWIYIIGFIIIIIGPSILVYKITNDYVPTTAMATAISTATLAIVTFLTLKHLRESESREIKEKVYSVVHRQLEAFLQPKIHTVRFDDSSRGLSIRWDWKSLKNQQFHLAFRIPKEVFNRLEEFTVYLNKYIEAFTQCVKKILKEISSRVEKIWVNESEEIFYVEILVKGKKMTSQFDPFESLFLSKDVRKNLEEFRLTNEADGELNCRFLTGAREVAYSTKKENEIVEFFENLFKHIRENSQHYKNLVTARESAKDLARQISKRISPS